MVLSGAKTTTVRTKRYGSVGDEFELDGRAFILTATEMMPLEKARDTVWKEEGMASPEEFERVWSENHPQRGFRGEDAVWVHHLRAIG